jgi:NAD+ diphosphatase
VEISIDRITRSRRNLFTSVRLDRLVEYRDNDEWVQEALESESARLVPLWRSRSLIDDGPDGQKAAYLRAGDLRSLDAITPPTLLGTDRKRYFFAVSINDSQRDEIQAVRPSARFVDLRRASLDMDAKHAGVLAYATALHYWQHRHLFCGACGSPNRLRSSGHKMVCSNEECGRESFPRIDPAIIVLITHRDSCLLARNVDWPPKRFSTLAGFVEPGESLEDAVVREVYEEASIQLSNIQYVSSQPWPFPASAMCGFYAEAQDRTFSTSSELAELQWFTAKQLTEAVKQGSILLSPPVSIAFRLLADWFSRQGGGDLEELSRQHRRSQ